jgi:hypothetical protein
MSTPLSIPEIEGLVLEEAKAIDRALAPDQVHVFESPDATDLGTLIVQIVARRPKGRMDWTRSRLRFSQAVRDRLVKHGDDRYPLIEVFSPEEWHHRND